MHRQKRTTPRSSITIVGSAVVMLAFFGFIATTEAATKFGAKLHTSDGAVIQPNANESCQRSGLPKTDRCTRVAVRYTLTGATAGNVRAPRDGVIGAIKFVAQGAGNINFELARVRHYQGGENGRARVVARTSSIHYEFNRTGPQSIQTVHLRQKVEKGDYLAIESRHFGMLRCLAESPQQLLFQPALRLGDPFTRNKGRSSGCTVLMQALYAKGQ